MSTANDPSDESTRDSEIAKRCVAILDEGITAEIDLSPIDELLAAAEEGFRLYELLRLSGPEELRKYTKVRARCREDRRPAWWNRDWRNDEGTLEIAGIGELSPWVGDSTSRDQYRLAWDRSDAKWRGERQADARWPEVAHHRNAAIASGDPLTRHEVGQILAFAHPNDQLLETGRLSSRVQRHFDWRVERLYSKNVYSLIAGLLEIQEISAFTYRGRGDWHLIRLACIEQIKREGRVPESESEAFPIRLLIPGSGASLFDPDEGELVSLNPYPSWSGGCRFQHEGIRLEGLCVDDGGFGARSLINTEDDDWAMESVQVIVARDPGDGPRLPQSRRWYGGADATLFGVLPSVDGELGPILIRHGHTIIHPQHMGGV